MAILIPIISFSVEVMYYKTEYFGLELILGAFYECPGFAVPLSVPSINVEMVDLPMPQATLMELRRGTGETYLLVPGLDIYEYRKENPYRASFEKAVLTAVKKLGIDPSVYIYQYPSFFESMWQSGKRLAEFVKKADLNGITIIAHSKGGLVTRVALRYEDFRKRVKKVYFLGTPHFGSPLAEALNVQPGNFEKIFGVPKKIADTMRLALALSYTAGYINSIGSKELSWMNDLLPPFENYDSVEYIFIAGLIRLKTLSEIQDYLTLNMKPDWIAPAAGLFYLSLISDMAFKGKGQISYGDGLVPVVSALALGKLKGKKYILWGYNHARLMMDEELMEKIMSGQF